MPKEDTNIVCTVENKNTEGVMCTAVDSNLKPLNIILPIRWHTKRVQMLCHQLSVKQRVTVRVIGTRFAPGETKLDVIAEFVCKFPNRSVV